MKKLLFACILLCSIALMTGQAFSLQLALYPSQQTIPAVGANRDVDLRIAGLANGGAPSLGAFDLKITFDESIVSFDSVTFYENLGDPDLDQGPGWTSFETDIFVDASTDGSIRLMETSLLFSDELDMLQGSGFPLARLNFKGEKVGYNTLGFKDVVLSDAFGSQLPDPKLEGAALNVVVPEPATLFLFLFGFGLFVLFAEKRRKKGMT